MKSSTGRWVSGDDFFDRERELALLESRVRAGNHMAMTGQRRMDELLSWLRAIFQKGDSGHPVLILSGSIGLAPLVERLGISDRINYLDSIRLRPWNLETFGPMLRDAHDDLRTIR